MRILVLDDAALGSALRDAGHEVLCAGCGGDCDLVFEQVVPLKTMRALLNDRDFAPEAVVWGGGEVPPSATGWEVLEVPTLAVVGSVREWHPAFSAACDLVLLPPGEDATPFAGSEVVRAVEPLDAATEQERAVAVASHLEALRTKDGWRWRVEHPYPVRRELIMAFKALAAEQALSVAQRDAYRKLSVIYLMAQ